MIDAPAPIEEHRFPCPSCGSDLHYDAKAGQLKCVHCGHEEPVAITTSRHDALKELDFEAALNDELAAEDVEVTRVIACQSCGAQTELAADAQATRCPFCDTPVVTDTGTHRHIKPRAIIAFALTEREARGHMGKWLGRLWFAPGGLKEYARKGRTMDGIYVPYWTFDARTNTDYRGSRGDDYWETKTVRRNGETKNVRTRKTRWRNVRGHVARAFDDVLVLASRSLPKRYTDALEPWNLSELTAYQPEYLSGFLAEGYQVELNDGFGEAKKIMEQIIRQVVRRDIGGDKQRISHLDTETKVVTFKHVLLPVWMAAYKYRGKTYRFVVNGQTGKVMGERPYSAVKIAFAVLAGLIIAGGIAYFVSINQ